MKGKITETSYIPPKAKLPDPNKVIPESLGGSRRTEARNRSAAVSRVITSMQRLAKDLKPKENKTKIITLKSFISEHPTVSSSLVEISKGMYLDEQVFIDTFIKNIIKGKGQEGKELIGIFNGHYECSDCSSTHHGKNVRKGARKCR